MELTNGVFHFSFKDSVVPANITMIIRDINNGRDFVTYIENPSYFLSIEKIKNELYIYIDIITTNKELSFTHEWNEITKNRLLKILSS